MSNNVSIENEYKYFYGYINLAAVWIIYFINVGLLMYGTSGLNSAMVSSRGFDAVTVGLAVSICTFMQGVMGAALVYTIERKGIRFSFALGSILITAGSMLISFYTANESFFIIFYGFFIGSGMGLGGVVTAQSAVNIWFESKKPMAMAVALSAGGIGGFVAPIILEFIIGFGSWTSGWLFISAGCMISLILSVTIVKNKPSDLGDVPDGKLCKNKSVVESGLINKIAEFPVLTVKEIFSHSPVYHILYNTASRNILYFAVIGHMVIFIVSNGIIREKAVLFISVLSLTSLIGRFVFGFLCQGIIKPKFSLSLGNISMALGVILIIYMPANLYSIYIGGVLAGMGLGAGYIASPLINSDYLGSVNFPRVMGASSPINYTVSALGPLITGYIASATGSYTITFLIFSIISITGGITILFSKPFKI